MRIVRSLKFKRMPSYIVNSYPSSSVIVSESPYGSNINDGLPVKPEI